MYIYIYVYIYIDIYIYIYSIHIYIYTLSDYMHRMDKVDTKHLLPFLEIGRHDWTITTFQMLLQQSMTGNTHDPVHPKIESLRVSLVLVPSY